jgi:hypothetical protein
MTLGGPRWGWAVLVGRQWGLDACVGIWIGVGFRSEAEPGEVYWRHSWYWSSASLPRVILREFRWRGIKIVLPVGYRAFGRARIFWSH